MGSKGLVRSLANILCVPFLVIVIDLSLTLSIIKLCCVIICLRREKWRARTPFEQSMVPLLYW